MRNSIKLQVIIFIFNACLIEININKLTKLNFIQIQ